MVSYVKNYRLVPLLPVFSKIFERIIYNATFKHFLDNDLIYSTQSSFKPSYYCINVFDVITHNIFKGFDDGLEEAFYLISLKLLTMHGMRDLSTNLSNWNL